MALFNKLRRTDRGSIRGDVEVARVEVRGDTLVITPVSGSITVPTPKSAVRPGSTVRIELESEQALQELALGRNVSGLIVSQPVVVEEVPAKRPEPIRRDW